MQDGHPVAYASRSLTPTEFQYAQIAKELVAIVLGMEKFETYLYGRKVVVESDHKPLEAMFKKTLLNTPKTNSSDPGPLPLTKVEQVPPVAESMPQEVVKPQATTKPSLLRRNKSRKDVAPGEESYEDKHTSVTMHGDTFPVLFMFSEQ